MTGSEKILFRGGSIFLLVAISCQMALAEESTPPEPSGILDSLDDDIEWIQAEAVIFSASKKEEKLFTTSAAAYVVTSEDIRRSGVTSIPDALRMVPGVNVAQIDASKWAVSIRGFNDRFANKLLVLIDGRSIYTPAFSGVYWEIHDVILEDVDRIEVIRGPGATLWGANAVNGVINIITRKTGTTQGVFVEAGGGNQQQGFGSFRYGGKLGDNATYRLYGKYVDRDSNHDDSVVDTEDDWRLAMGGFRMDWDITSEDRLMLQAGMNTVTAGTSQNQVNLAVNSFASSLTKPLEITTNDDFEFDTFHTLARWEHQIAENESFSLQLFYDRYVRHDALQQFQETIDTIDLEFQHNFPLLDVHEITWGAGYRTVFSDVDNSAFLNTTDPERNVDLVNAFVQDRFTLIPDRLFLTAGSKFEYNDFTGFEMQPGIRLAWTPGPKHTAWASVTRAVRTPSLLDDGLTVVSSLDRFQVMAPVPDPSAPQNTVLGTVQGINTTILLGNDDFESEELVAYEVGYRHQFNEALTVDVAAFYNDYSDLRTADIIQGAPTLTGVAGINPVVYDAMAQTTILFNNDMTGETYGAEVAANWQVTDIWRLAATYSYVEIQLHNRAQSPNGIIETDEGRTPENQASLRSHLDLPWNLEFDTGLYYADTIIGGAAGRLEPGPGVPAYLRLDARIGWRPRENLEFSVVAQNLGDNQHREFSSTPDNVNSSEVKRSVYAVVQCRF